MSDESDIICTSDLEHHKEWCPINHYGKCGPKCGCCMAATNGSRLTYYYCCYACIFAQMKQSNPYLKVPMCLEGMNCKDRSKLHRCMFGHPCKYGKACKRKDKDHLSRFTHSE